MPGRLFLTDDPAPQLAVLGIDAAAWHPFTPRANIAPGQEVVAVTADGPHVMRWGLIPVGRVNARGRPVMETIVNARSETVFDKSAFAGLRRAALPVQGWYEWTGKPRHKTAWRIALQSGGLLWFAAIWDVWTAPGGAELAQLALVTCPPSGDVAAIHDRMGVVLEPQDVRRWTTAPEDEVKDLMRPWPDGRLEVGEAMGIDWDGP